jgi:hypothetical protein
MSTLEVSRLFGVKGYVAVVTGGSSGLGFMISKACNPFSKYRDET